MNMSNKTLAVVSAEEIFAIDKNVRWVGLISVRGDIILNKMRPSIKSSSPPDFDAEFLRLGPLTMLGVAEKYSPYLLELEAVVVWYGLMALVYSRLGSQIVAISVENRKDTLSIVRSWLKKRKIELRKN